MNFTCVTTWSIIGLLYSENISQIRTFFSEFSEKHFKSTIGTEYNLIRRIPFPAPGRFTLKLFDSCFNSH